ncbi:MAG: DUF721 domain-containing protein [Parvularculaceae bacterium]
MHQRHSPPTVNTRAARKAPPAIARASGKELARLAQASGAMDPRLAQKWPEIAGPELAKICRPLRLKRNGRAQILQVAALHGAAAMQVQYQLPALLGKVNSFLGHGRVTKIAIVQRATHALKREEQLTKKGLSPTGFSRSDVARRSRPAIAPAKKGDLMGALARMKKLMDGN